MKKLLLIFLAIVPIFSIAQKPGQAGSLRLFENNRPFSLPDGQGNNLDIPLEQIEGSPYLKKQFLPGKVYEADKNAGTFLMRYNIYNDVMEIMFKENEIQELLIHPRVKASIGTSRFIVHDYLDNLNNKSKGYFEILSNGDKINLLKKHRVKFSPGEPAKTSFHKATKPKFEYLKEYYFRFREEELPIRIKKLKENHILYLLKEHGIAKEIIQAQNLDIRKEKDLIKLVEELNNSSI